MDGTPSAAELQPLIDKYIQWDFSPNTAGPLLSKASFDDRPDRNVSLKCLEPNHVEFLIYEEQTFGINLGFSRDATANTEQAARRWFFARQEGNGGQITFGEKLALAEGIGRSFLYYTGRPFGINLDWSNPPVYEWQIVGGTVGSPVNRNTRVAIFNAKVGEFFVYFDRNIGAEIGWSDSERWEDQLTGELEALVKQYGEQVVKEAIVALISA